MLATPKWCDLEDVDLRSMCLILLGVLAYLVIFYNLSSIDLALVFLHEWSWGNLTARLCCGIEWCAPGTLQHVAKWVKTDFGG